MTKPLTVMVSSTVYGLEELLDRIRALLHEAGYEVWMSHFGTVQVFSNRHAFDDCLDAVAKCDLFLSIITPQYGSGVLGDELAITHQELLKAIELDKPRWVLAHDHVIFARSLLSKLSYKGQKVSRRDLTLTKSRVFEDLRVIDMYEAATREDIKNPAERTGNWAQKYSNDEEAMLFAVGQFRRYHEVEEFLKEHFTDKVALAKALAARAPK